MGDWLSDDVYRVLVHFSDGGTGMRHYGPLLEGGLDPRLERRGRSLGRRTRPETALIALRERDRSRRLAAERRSIHTRLVRLVGLIGLVADARLGCLVLDRLGVRSEQVSVLYVLVAHPRDLRHVLPVRRVQAVQRRCVEREVLAPDRAEEPGGVRAGIGRDGGVDGGETDAALGDAEAVAGEHRAAWPRPHRDDFQRRPVRGRGAVLDPVVHVLDDCVVDVLVRRPGESREVADRAWKVPVSLNCTGLTPVPVGTSQSPIMSKSAWDVPATSQVRRLSESACRFCACRSRDVGLGRQDEHRGGEIGADLDVGLGSAVEDERVGQPRQRMDRVEVLAWLGRRGGLAVGDDALDLQVAQRTDTLGASDRLERL